MQTTENKPESQPIEVFTENSKAAMPCGYNESIVYQIKLRISNTMANELIIEKKAGGYSSDAEYVRDAIREKIYRDRMDQAILDDMKNGAWK